MSLSERLVHELRDSEGSPGGPQSEQVPQDADSEPTQVRGVALIPLPVLPRITSAYRVSQSFWRVSVVRGQDSVNVYVSDDSVAEEEQASVRALARAEVLERFRDTLEAL